MYKIVLFILMVSISSLLYAQQQKDFAHYNNETYQLYLDANWESLVELGKESMANEFDFYYLRIRIGIAYYEQQKYIQAIRHFEKALEFTPGSAEAKNYLYYCYLFLGRTKEALNYYGPDGIKSKFFSSATFEPGIKFSDNRALTRDTKYVFIGLNNDFSKRISLFHGYQRLIADFALPPDNSTAQNETLYSVKQNEYYAALTVLAAKGLYVIPAFHYQDVNSDIYHGKNKVFSVQIAKWLSKFKIYAGMTYSEINELNQNQYEGGLVFYPMGNTNLFLQTQLTYHSQNSIHNLVFYNMVGTKLFAKTWMDVFFAYGDMNNYSDLNGYVVYNQLDTLKSKIGFTLNQSLGKHLLYLKYTRENKEEYISETPFAHYNIVLGFNLKF
jgi:hypothetical protein